MTSGVPPVALRETCRVARTDATAGLEACVPLWPWHRQRLREGGCGPSLLGLAEDRALAAIAAHPAPLSSRLRLTVLAAADGDASAEVADRLSSLDVPGGPTTALVEVPGGPELPPGAAKPADRGYWDAAMRRARPASQALLVDRDGVVIDGGTATVWVLAAGRLLTPPAPPAVAGVSRRFLLANADRLGVEVAEEPVSAGAVDAADELFLSNAFAGAVAVRGRGGEIAERARRIFADLWAQG